MKKAGPRIGLFLFSDESRRIRSSLFLNGTVEMESPDESLTLISAGKVQGTPVFDLDGHALGEIYDVMLEKRTGRVAYAVMSFGGVLGIGKKYHPLPWLALKYVPDAGGYVVGIPRETLQSGPTINDSSAPWETGLQQKIEGYYGTWLSAT